MSSMIQELSKKGLINPPSWLPMNVHYEAILGSESYGVSGGGSDMDIGGFCIPPKDMIFPHLRGEVPGFGRQVKRFDQYQQHHIMDPDALGGKGREHDFSIYSIVKFFQLCMENNPNMIDMLFVPDRCVLHITRLGTMVREQRHLFLHKGSWHKFKGYAYSQLHKMRTKDPQGKRRETVEKYGYDVKFAYHLVRLLNEVEQILTEHDLDLERNREQLKAIRAGEWTMSQVEDYFTTKERELESVYTNSTLRYGPDEEGIKTLLLYVLEEHYGNLGRAIVRPNHYRDAIDQIAEIVNRAQKNM